MNVLVVEPMKRPYLKDIDPSLDSFRKEVGGYIKAIYPYEEPVGLVCNKEGKLDGLLLNRAVYGAGGEMFGFIAGTFLIVGLSGNKFSELSDDLADKYTKLFESPEVLCSANGRMHARKVEPEPMQELKHKDFVGPTAAASLRRFAIYQLKASDELHGMRFKPFNYLRKNGIACDIRNYDLVYSGHMRPHETLEALFYKFNMERPDDFKGNPLLVSDVIVIKERGKSTAYYVESFGFKQLDRFERSHARTPEIYELCSFER